MRLGFPIITKQGFDISNIRFVIDLHRKTGLAGFRSFLPLSYGLVLEGILAEKQLKEKLYLNPKKIIEKGGYRLKI